MCQQGKSSVAERLTRMEQDIGDIRARVLPEAAPAAIPANALAERVERALDNE